MLGFSNNHEAKLQNTDYNGLKFLESASNIKVLIEELVGKKPSTRLATEISVCLQQGRMFFDAAIESPSEIKPLQIFYGMIGFAKALTLAKCFKNLETLTPSHGLKDITVQNSRIEDIQLKILSKGTFQHFNDVISQYDRVHWFEKYMPTWHYIPTTASDKLAGKKISLKEILARIPGLEDLYKNTFQESPKTWPASIHYDDNNDGFTELRIDDPEIYSDRSSAKKIVNKWREKFPFLNNWCLREITKAWGYSIIIFGNIDKADINDLDENILIEHHGQFSVNLNKHRNGTSFKPIDFYTILPPLYGGITGSCTNMVESYQGEYISEYSLYYLGMHLLSSLVRYRPQVWTHSLSRSVTIEKNADDRALAIIEEFMNRAITEFPNMIINALKTNFPG